jgi:hypothetical protein
VFRNPEKTMGVISILDAMDEANSEAEHFFCQSPPCRQKTAAGGKDKQK